MSQQAKAEFVIKQWNEQPYSEADAVPKLTRASVVKAYTGELEGEGTVEQLAVYRADGSASFVALERVVGRIGVRAGSFVLQHSGTFAGGIAQGTWVVVSGSATGDLVGLRGSIAFASGHAAAYSITFEYDFE